MTKLTIVLSILIFTSCKAQEILYEPIGVMDKPLPKIYISKFCKENNSNCYTVPQRTITDLVKLDAKRFEQKEYNNEEKEYPYGAYRVTVMKNKRQYNLILKDKKESLDYFKKHLPYLRTNHRLYIEIETLIKRLK